MTSAVRLPVPWYTVVVRHHRPDDPAAASCIVLRQWNGPPLGDFVIQPGVRGPTVLLLAPEDREPVPPMLVGRFEAVDLAMEGVAAFIRSIAFGHPDVARELPSGSAQFRTMPQAARLRPRPSGRPVVAATQRLSSDP